NGAARYLAYYFHRAKLSRRHPNILEADDATAFMMLDLGGIFAGPLPFLPGDERIGQILFGRFVGGFQAFVFRVFFGMKQDPSSYLGINVVDLHPGKKLNHVSNLSVFMRLLAKDLQRITTFFGIAIGPRIAYSQRK